MAEPYCEHCDLPLDQCVHGMPKTERASTPYARLVADGPTITSQTYSECPGCGEQIEPGEQITHTEDGWAHADEVEQRRSNAPDLFEGI